MLDFIISNWVWMQSEIDKNSQDAYWLTVKGSLNQVVGYAEGYLSSPCSTQIRQPLFDELSLNAQRDDILNLERFDALHVLMMQSWGDLYTISTKVELDSKNITTGQREKRIFYPETEIERDLRCSSLFKLLPDYSDVLFGHTSWSSFIALGPRY